MVKPKTIHRAIKYRLFPDEEQEIQINRTFGCVRKVYNMGLEMQMGLYASGFKTMSKTDMNNYCNRAWKTEFPFLREVDKFALTHSIYDLDAAYKNFFEGRAKFPRFKSKKNPRNSYTTNFTNENISVTGGKNGKGSVKLPKLGSVDAKVHRIPPANWNITGATISKSASGKYFVSILFSIQAKIPAPQLDEDNAIGLDYSSPDFHEDSDGNKPNVPHAYRKSERRLAKEQRKLSRMEYGSQNYLKQKKVVAEIHEHVANQRRDFCHKESRKIANSYDIVCVEDLDLHAQAQALRFGKAIGDNGFGMFRTALQYKLDEQGKAFVKIDKWFPSTKTCHHCGTYNPDVVLGQNKWICPGCGKIIPRNKNAALNIRDEGLRVYRQRAR